MNVADKWEDLGVQLLRSDQHRMLNVIAKDNPKDAVSCCKCVLKKWLDTTADATWNQLLKVLESPSIGLHHLASEVKYKMCKNNHR